MLQGSFLNKIPQVLYSLRDPVIMGDNDLVITGMNQRACDFLGWSEAEVRGKHISFLLSGHPEEAPQVPMIMKAKPRKAADIGVIVQTVRDPQATLVAWSLLPIVLPATFDFNFHATFEQCISPKLVIEDMNFRNKKVLMRVDYNVPVDKKLGIRDDNRIRATIPTLLRVLNDGGMLILMSHMGRPKGKFDPLLTLKPVADRLGEMLSRPVLFAPDTTAAMPVVQNLKPGEVLLLENLRFYKGEDSRNYAERQAFAALLASYGDIFVSEAFGTAHRDSASMTGVPRLMGAGAIGFLMKKEVSVMSMVLRSPQQPVVAIVGGAKVSDKIALLGNLFNLASCVIIGGSMAFTFLEANGYSIGNSRIERMAKGKGKEIDLEQVAKELLQRARQKKVKVILPVDHVATTALKMKLNPRTVTTQSADVPEGFMGVDIGPKTIQICADEIRQARTVIWNGPVGVFEIPAFATGCKELGRAIAENKNCLSVVGGGDTAAAIKEFKDSISHVSTGGGATLELLEGKALPGLICLTSRAQSNL